MASDADRLQMLELALCDEPGISVDDSEIRRGGVSYSIETIRAYRMSRPDTQLFWIIGADQLRQLDSWRGIEEIVKMISFMVFGRPGFELSAPAIPGLEWIAIDAPLMDESSSAIRNRISGGSPVDGLLPPAVETFIRDNGLYT